MQIEVVDFVAGARGARGIAVVIDVFRAFSLAAYAFGRGARSVIPVGSIERARELKRDHPDWLLVGERHARRLPGFDCGNSPTQLEQFELHDRTLIHTTHAGTQGLVNADFADEVLTGALVNAAAIVRYIDARKPEHVTLIRMGHEASERCEEDDACAEIIAGRLMGAHVHEAKLVASLRQASSAQKFFDPACDWAPEGDFERCTQLDKFDFVLRLSRDAKLPSLSRFDC
jgi:2-phosphosulfolactate phosphatase